ncbi:MAG: beta-propeller fold lactonase family protein [Pseudomonadota bacterium]|nr:beta-propeller fold lactonase family protein [Pseudomonadota bacterium]
MTAVYVSNADSGEISVLHLDERGTLETLQEMVVGGQVMPLAVSPHRRFLYAARRSEPRAVIGYRIYAETGELALIGQAPLPESMAFIATDRSGRFLFSASYGGGLVAVSPVDADGRPQPAHQVLCTGPKAHAIQSDPANRHVFATSLESDRVLQYRFDAGSGRLLPNDPPALAVRSRAGPRHFVFHPRLPRVYLLNELDAGVDVLAYDARRGTLAPLQTVTALPAGFSGEPWAAELRLTPDGRFLYTSERRSSTIAGFAVDAASGCLAPIGQWATQTQPRGMAIDPPGHFLIVAGQLSHHVGVHRIDPDSGALALVGEHAVGANPSWVEAITPG